MSTLFEMAARRGLYVEIVALADSAHYGMDLAALRRQVSATGGIAAGYPNVVVQVANEHYHPTQSGELHDPRASPNWAGWSPLTCSTRSRRPRRRPPSSRRASS